MVTKKCERCGSELPITEFFTRKGIPHKVCKKCEALKRKQNKMLNETIECNPDLAKYTSRDLILELRARGYQGELSLIKITKVKL